jgi:hypothetical protein
MEHHIGQFSWEVFNNWAGYFTGGGIMAVITFWHSWREQQIRRKLLIGLTIFFFALGSYKAWEEQYEKAEIAGINSDNSRHVAARYETRFNDLSDSLLTASNKPPTGSLQKFSNFTFNNNAIGAIFSANDSGKSDKAVENDTYKNVPPTQIVENQNFQYEDVIVDGKKFINCTFTRCRMIFQARSPSEWHDCTLTESIWTSPKPEIRDWTMLLKMTGLVITNNMVNLEAH